MLRALIVVVGFGVVAVTGNPSALHAAELPWVGIWTGVGASACKLKDKIGDQAGAPIRITAKEVTGYENSCAIKAVKPGSLPRTWLITEECTGEGNTSTQQRLYIVTKDDKVLNIADAEGTVTKFDRCK